MRAKLQHKDQYDRLKQYTSRFLGKGFRAWESSPRGEATQVWLAPTPTAQSDSASLSYFEFNVLSGEVFVTPYCVSKYRPFNLDLETRLHQSVYLLPWSLVSATGVELAGLLIPWPT